MRLLSDLAKPVDDTYARDLAHQSSGSADTSVESITTPAKAEMAVVQTGMPEVRVKDDSFCEGKITKGLGNDADAEPQKIERNWFLTGLCPTDTAR